MIFRRLEPIAPRPAPRFAFGSPRRSRSAFTMVEIALSLAVIGIALVGIIGVLPRGMDVQKNNRRETIINQDANYFIEAIRGGAHGLDDLTNSVISITNYWTKYRADGTTNGLPSGHDGFDYYNSHITSFNNPPSDGTWRLTNGLRIIGVLSTPKYTTNDATTAIGPGAFQSNYVVAYFRAISGAATEKSPQDNDIIKEAAFGYRLVSELVPCGVASNGFYYAAWTNFLEVPAVVGNSAAVSNIWNGVTNWAAALAAGTNANPVVTSTNYISANTQSNDIANLSEFTNRANYWLLSRQTTPNLYDLRLLFRWPLLPNSRIGPGRQAYRAMVGGSVTNEPGTNEMTSETLWPSPTYFVRPQNYFKAQ